MRNKPFALLAALAVALAGSLFAATPKVGEMAPNFTLKTLEGTAVELSPLWREKPVVLVVLRGWPGYQCPLCTKQVHEFVARSADFTEAGARVLMVYPGPADKLQAHAQEFLRDKQWPANFLFVLDPDYRFTNQYELRWNAKNETAYPSTFIVDRSGKIGFAQVSHSHGGRVSATAALDAVRAAK